jgi:D-amino-acid dehydrogenase
LPHIAIIGAGIAGVTTAYSLLERGYDVTVLERHRYPAMETSFANGGQLSASNAEVWNHPSTILKGLRWMVRKDAPLLLNPAFSWHKYSWVAEFIGHIPHYRANTVETARLAVEARRRLFAIAERERIAFDHVRRGILHVYRSKAEFDHAASVNELLREGGLDRHAVTPEEIVALEPALNGSFYGGFHTPSDSTGDIHKFTIGLAAACVRKGARFIHDAAVERIAHGRDGIAITWGTASTGGETLLTDAVVVCAGTASREIAARLGDRVNVYPVKGYSITVHLDDVQSRESAPWMSLLDDKAKIVTSRLGPDRFRVAGTAEFNGCNRDVRADRVQPLVSWVRQLFPGIATSRIVSWAGLRPMMPNMMPCVKAGQRPNIFYNTGHGHLGWTLSAATSEIVADMVHQRLSSSKMNAAA